MKAKIDIEIWDQTTKEQLDDVGITNKFIEHLYYTVFNNMLEKDYVGNGCEYSLNVEVLE